MQQYQEILSTGKMSKTEFIEKYQATYGNHDQPPPTQGADVAESEFAAAHQEFLAGNGELSTTITADEDNLESEHDESIPDFVVDDAVAVKQEPSEITMSANNEPEPTKIKKELPELSSSQEQNQVSQDSLSPLQGM